MKPVDAIAEAVRRAPVYRSTWFSPALEDAKLNHNESADELDTALQAEVLERIAQAQWHRYPDAHSSSLVGAFASAWGVEPKQVVVGPGANTLIARVIASLHKETTLIVCPPTYYVYERLARAHGLKVAEAPLLDRDNVRPFDVDVDAVLAAAGAASRPVLALVNPNNPTGNLCSAGAIKALLERFDGLTIVDEAYHDFAGETLMRVVNQHPQLVILRTLSKAAALAGWRVGGLASSPELAIEFAKLAPPYELSMPAQVAGEVVLAHGVEIAAAAARVRKTRDQLSLRLDELGPYRVFKSDTNFLLIEAGEHRSRVLSQLGERRVTIRDVHKIAGLEGCLRVSVGRDEENDRVVAAFRAAL